MTLIHAFGLIYLLMEDFTLTHGQNRGPDLIQQIGRGNVVTSMSKVFFGYNSTLAIDGQDRYDLDTCNCCSVTEDEHATSVWWLLDLRKIYPLQEIVFYGRGDKADEFVQFQLFKLFLGNGTTFPDSPFFTHDPAIQPGSKISINVSNQLVQTIKIVLDNQIMSICEVKVYEGDCATGRFGEECVEECNCLDGQPCQRNDGVCQSQGCTPGWQSNSCNKECVGSYGDGCREQCGACRDNMPCNHITGTCWACADGFNFTADPNCHIKCDNGTHGEECNSQCGHCRSVEDCESTDGTCRLGCVDGYQGFDCKQKCSPGNFGPNCSRSCKCFHEHACDHVTGYCTNGVCPAGFTGTDCSIPSPQSQVQVCETCSCGSKSTIGGVIGAVILLGVEIVALLGYILIRRWRQKKNAETHEPEIPKENVFNIYEKC